MTLINLINAKASLMRVEHFFGYGDKDLTDFNTDDEKCETGDINFTNCKFSWDNEKIRKHYESGKELYQKSPGAKPAGDKKEDKEKDKDKSKKKKKKSKGKKKEKNEVVDGEEVVKKKKKKKSKKKAMMNEEGSL